MTASVIIIVSAHLVTYRPFETLDIVEVIGKDENPQMAKLYVRLRFGVIIIGSDLDQRQGGVREYNASL